MCNVAYLKFINDKLCLNESCIYYTQAQIQLYVSGCMVCDLFLYTPIKNGSCCIEVKRNEKFLQNVILKCDKFYFQNYLPKLIDDVKNKNKLDCNKKNNSFTGDNMLNIM